MSSTIITLVYVEPDWTHEEILHVGAEATIADVLSQSSLWELLAKRQHTQADLLLNQYLSGERKIGIYNKIKQVDDVVHDGDRIELYRPLLINPKEARRKKAKEK
jgi:putative ubiquitin-RnfH superfamily antitoxin RatB of RatAB toxin-antitoxin module